MHRLAAALLFLVLSAAAFAEGPATRPTTRPNNPIKPMDFLVSYDQLAGEDPAAYLAMYSMEQSDDDLQRLAHVESKFDAQIGMLQKIVQQKWGESAVNETLHALGLKTLRDIQSGTLKEDNGRASVIFADGTPGPDLIHTRQGWRFDLNAFRASLGVPVDDYLKQIRKLSKILPDLADGIADGKLTSSSAVVSDIAKRIDALQ